MALVQAMKEPKAMAEVNLMPQKYQPSMKSSPQKIKDHALGAVDPNFQNRCTKHIIQPNNRFQNMPSTRQNYERIDNPQNLATIETKMIQPYHFKLSNK